MGNWKEARTCSCCNVYTTRDRTSFLRHQASCEARKLGIRSRPAVSQAAKVRKSVKNPNFAGNSALGSDGQSCAPDCVSASSQLVNANSAIPAPLPSNLAWNPQQQLMMTPTDTQVNYNQGLDGSWDNSAYQPYSNNFPMLSSRVGNFHPPYSSVVSTPNRYVSLYPSEQDENRFSTRFPHSQNYYPSPNSSNSHCNQYKQYSTARRDQETILTTPLKEKRGTTNHSTPSNTCITRVTRGSYTSNVSAPVKYQQMESSYEHLDLKHQQPSIDYAELEYRYQQLIEWITDLHRR